MRRPLLLAALVIPILPVLAAPPAYAAGNVICVNTADASCTPGQEAASIPAAITLANGNSIDDTILVGAGSYTEPPLTLNGSIHALTLKGSGQGVTFITLADSASPQTYVSAGQATVQDLTVTMKGGANSDNDRGLAVSDGSLVERVTVAGAGTLNARGLNTVSSQVTSSSILMPISDPNSRAIYSDGGSTVTDTVIEGSAGFVHSGGATTDVLSRVTIRAKYGVSLDSGTVDVANAVIDLGVSAGVGLLASNSNGGLNPMTINADHVTVVGGGPGSVGVAAVANIATAKQTALVTLDNSIVRGQNSSMEVAAGNNGSQGGNSDAKIVVDYSSYDAGATSVNVGANGTGGLTVGPGVLDDPDPLFVDAPGGDYRLSPTSPLIDVGNPAAGGPATDRDGAMRVVDGNKDTTAVRDLGAYESPDTTAPETVLVTGPAGPTADATPTYAFSSEPGATFECKVDGGAFASCASPFTSPSLGNGPHTFEVRATDLATNVDPTPATRAFTVDTAAPETTFTKTPDKKVFAKKVKFKFTSAESGVTFQCKRDAKAYVSCTSPFRWKVKVGKHVLLVRAVDAAGNVDATPARYRFKRIPKPTSGCAGEC